VNGELLCAISFGTSMKASEKELHSFRIQGNAMLIWKEMLRSVEFLA
jgi:hypothetical protein